MTAPPLTILVLGGGPDRERPVSFQSGAAVAAALGRAGHTVIEADITPDDLSALDIPCDVVFPLLHGKWGEGGTLQRWIEQRGLPYVGSGARASARAIDKCATKQAAQRRGIPTPPYQHLSALTPLQLPPPVVIKPLTEGSSFGIYICHDLDSVAKAREQLHPHHAFLLAEQYITGREITVGLIDDQPLPPLEVRAAHDFYDYAAKYERADTHYSFEIDLPQHLLDRLREYALILHQALGCRHLSRCDFIVDQDHQPWLLEINTIPGFTDHSLLPMAAARVGLTMQQLCDKLARLTISDTSDR